MTDTNELLKAVQHATMLWMARTGGDANGDGADGSYDSIKLLLEWLRSQATVNTLTP